MGVQGKVVSIASHCDVWSIQADVVDYESQPKARLKVWSANEVSIRGCGGGDGPQWGLGAEISWGRGGGANGAKIGVFWRVCDANDARFFSWWCKWCTCFRKGALANSGWKCYQNLYYLEGRWCKWCKYLEVAMCGWHRRGKGYLEWSSK